MPRRIRKKEALEFEGSAAFKEHEKRIKEIGEIFERLTVERKQQALKLLYSVVAKQELDKEENKKVVELVKSILPPLSGRIRSEVEVYSHALVSYYLRKLKKH